MRVMLTVSMPVATFNQAVRDGSAGPKIGRILEETHPEAVYFTERNGLRTALIVADVKKNSDIPALSEPWFLTFDATVQIDIAMTPEDLKDADLSQFADER